MCDQWLDGDMLTPHENGMYDHKLAGLDLNGPRFVCINYDLLSMPRYFSIINSVPWDTIIFDEAHHLKNYKAQRTKTAFRLSYGKPRLCFVTGTPVRNYPMDLYPLFHMMNPREYYSPSQWRDWFCVTIEDEIWLKNPYTGKPAPRLIKKIVPGVRNEEILNKLLYRYMIRHERTEILKDLPPKQYEVVPIELGPESRQYQQMEDEYFAILDSGEEITAPRAIAQMTRLRQICCDPNTLLSEGPRPSTPSNKTLALLDIIDDTDSKMVVFSYFERYIDILHHILDEKGIKHVVVSGQIKGTARELAEQQFQSDAGTQVLLGTIGAAGEGPTYSAADIVVFCDLFWSPATNEQCEDRVYGRVDKGLKLDKSVLIIDLFCQNTVEEHVHKVVRAKEKMIDAIVTKRVVDSMRERRTK
jgi:SNF2 family DNA or RNA helicase